MGIHQEAKEQLNSLRPEEWQEIADAITSRSDYRPHQTKQNLDMTLFAAGLDLNGMDTEIAREFLYQSNYSGLAADKLAALARNDLTWFNDLQRRTSEE